MYVKGAKNGEMRIKFSTPLKIVGCDEFNVYLQDENHSIGGFPYIRKFSKQWKFIVAINGSDIGFEDATY